jgi:Ser/Thr protein kinase RdoA (MazF antagonist)
MLEGTGLRSGIATGASQLDTQAPELSLDEVRRLVRRLYGLSCTPSALTSERDQNLRLRCDTGDDYLLKIANPSEPRQVIALQTAALDHLARAAPAAPVPRLIPTGDGATCAEIALPGGPTTLVRLLTYLPGTPVWKTQRTAAQRRSLGRSLAELDLAFAGFSDPAATHDLLWNVSGAHRLAHMMAEIAEPARRGLINHFMSRFVEQVLPHLAGLRAQVIHNDFNLYNILVSGEDETRVTGIIDYGDILHAPLVAEVATAAAYQMADEADPIAAAAEFVAAYHEILPLLPEELDLVADLVATRHLITVLITEWRSRRYPANRDYILRHNPLAWRSLERLAERPPDRRRDDLLSQIHDRS